MQDRFTRTYRTQTNGKTERFIQSALRERAYGWTYQNAMHRTAALASWMHHYNWHRLHSGIGGVAPMTWLNASGHELVSRHGRADQFGLAGLVDAVNRKNVLGEADTHGQNRHGLSPPGRVDEKAHFPSWHWVAVRRNAAGSGRGSPFHSLGITETPFPQNLQMIEPATLLTFTLLNMSFALIPGPDVVCILTNAVTRGRRAGMLVCAGIACAALLHVAAASLGLTAFLAAVPTAFLAVKIIGAAYLAWLGWQMLRSPAGLQAETSGQRWASPFAQGAVSNLLNPKIAIFFLAILPQFIDPSLGHPGMQAAVLGIVSIVSGTAVNLCTATLGGKAGRWIAAKPHIIRRFQRVAGAALVGLGVKVAFERA